MQLLPLILASASPRRRELLERAELEFTLIPAQIDETVAPGETPEGHVRRLAQEKSRVIAAARPAFEPEAWVIGADTIVVLGEQIMGKPATPAIARQMLGELSGQSHTVLTAYALVNARSGVELSNCVETHIVFRPLTPEEISAYVATGEPLDKAGAYAIQGVAASFVSALEGSYENVVGLPLHEVMIDLMKIGVLSPDHPPLR